MTIMICNSWYWVQDAMGNKFKVCSFQYNCPNSPESETLCGMYFDDYDSCV